MPSGTKNAPVAILMGSDSDLPTMQTCVDQLKAFGINPIVRVLSAHRTPHQACEFAANAAGNGIKVIIAAAGMAAHLAGAVAARTTRPVIGIPVSSAALCGMDALFSTVQMPPGFPVATVATDKAGARNAAWLAAQILAVSDPALNERIAEARAKMREEVEKAGDEISRKYA